MNVKIPVMTLDIPLQAQKQPLKVTAAPDTFSSDSIPLDNISFIGAYVWGNVPAGVEPDLTIYGSTTRYKAGQAVQADEVVISGKQSSFKDIGCSNNGLTTFPYVRLVSKNATDAVVQTLPNVVTKEGSFNFETTSLAVPIATDGATGCASESIPIADLPSFSLLAEIWGWSAPATDSDILLLASDTFHAAGTTPQADEQFLYCVTVPDNNNESSKISQAGYALLSKKYVRVYTKLASGMRLLTGNV